MEQTDPKPEVVEGELAPKKKKSAAQLRRLELRENLRNGIIPEPIQKKETIVVPATTDNDETPIVMNAQQRRLAKRALARKEGDKESTNVDKEEIQNPAETAADVPMNAQQRRLAKRALARKEEQVNETKAEEAQAIETPPSNDPPMNAQQRRLAKRALARMEENEENTSEKVVGIKSNKIEDGGSTVTTARERRLAKRAAIRNGIKPDDDDKVEETDEHIEELFKNCHIPYVVFVGQLPYSATIDEILIHFTKVNIPIKHMKIRLLNDSKTGKSKGMAFVQFTSAEEQHQALQLHRSYFGKIDDGKRRRQINVEKSSGGGKLMKKQKIIENRSGQDCYMEETVSRILSDYINKNIITQELLDNDKYLLSMLKRCDASTVDHALDEFSKRDINDISNPAAYLTTIVCQKLAEAFDEKLKKENEINNVKYHKKDLSKKFASSSSSSSAGSKGNDNQGFKSSSFSDKMPSQYQFASSRGRGRGGRMGIERTVTSPP